MEQGRPPPQKRTTAEEITYLQRELDEMHRPPKPVDGGQYVLFFLAYGAIFAFLLFGALIDDIQVPRRGDVAHVRGSAAWLLVAAFGCATGLRLSRA